MLTHKLLSFLRTIYMSYNENMKLGVIIMTKNARLRMKNERISKAVAPAVGKSTNGIWTFIKSMFEQK